MAAPAPGEALAADGLTGGLAAGAAAEAPPGPDAGPEELWLYGERFLGWVPREDVDLAQYGDADLRRFIREDLSIRTASSLTTTRTRKRSSRRSPERTTSIGSAPMRWTIQ